MCTSGGRGRGREHLAGPLHPTVLSMKPDAGLHAYESHDPDLMILRS